VARLLRLALIPVFASACSSTPYYPAVGVQQTLYPGLGDLSEADIARALDEELALDPPFAAGLAWLSEGYAGDVGTGQGLSEFGRTGVLEAVISELSNAPFASVASLPTIPKTSGGGPSSETLRSLRSAAANFKHEVALLLQTATHDDQYFNPLAVTYVALVTAWIVPGTNIVNYASAELCAIDVRTGAMLGCARGRAAVEDGYVRPTRIANARADLREEAAREASVEAAKSLLGQLSARFPGTQTGAARPAS